MLVLISAGYSQVKISGTVYDISGKNPLEAVSVMTSTGNGTSTDKTGKYSIVARETDSIWFSYLNRPTPKYPVSTIANFSSFDISLHVAITTLPQVRVMPKNYRMDSIQNRLDYSKAFEFQKPGIGSAISPNGGMAGGVGLDINEFINMFKFRRNRRMLAFQERLLREEEERYIDHRFSRSLIIKLTQLRGAALDSFIVRYRPTVEFTETSTDYEFQYYIKACFLHFNRMQKIEGALQPKTEE